MSTLCFCFRKYVQVCVQNLSELDFRLSDSNLTDTAASADLQLAPLNTEPQQVSVCDPSVRASEGGGQCVARSLSVSGGGRGDAARCVSA